VHIECENASGHARLAEAHVIREKAIETKPTPEFEPGDTLLLHQLGALALRHLSATTSHE
jgi:hypothetical protein